MTRPLPYFQYTTRSRVDKAINSLLGLVEGVSIDGAVSDSERKYFDAWVREHQEVQELHPFSELIPILRATIADGIIDTEEREDLRWLCERLRSSEYYDRTTGDMQRLQSVLGGIAADAEITKTELAQLRDWLENHEHLRTLWPYDEVSSLISGVLQDGVIDETEHELLRAFFAEFISSDSHRVVGSVLARSASELSGVCASCPEVRFAGMKFCFTGESAKFSREELAETVIRLGGSVVGSVSGKTDFLVVGGDGNPCWAFACYGRKIEKAMALRRDGARLVIVHENDFHDAVLDQG